MEYVLNFTSIKHEAYCKMWNGLQNGLQNESEKYDAKMTTLHFLQVQKHYCQYNALTVIYSAVYTY